MPAMSVRLELDQGADYDKTFLWLVGPGVDDANPQDLTNAHAILEARVAADQAPALDISDTPNAQGALVLGGLEGTVEIQIANATTAVLPANLLFTLRITLASGKRSVFIDGTIYTKPSMVG